MRVVHLSRKTTQYIVHAVKYDHGGLDAAFGQVQFTTQNALIVQGYLFPFWNERKNLKDSHLWNYAERADCNINLCAKLI